MLYEFGDAALVVKLVRLFRLFAFVLDGDANALVEKGLFAKPLRKLFETETRAVKDLDVGPKRDLGSAFLVFPVCFSGATGIPRSYSCSYVLPSRQISSRSVSERKLTQVTPTPCSPPETL